MEKQDSEQLYEEQGDGLVQVATVEVRLTNLQGPSRKGAAKAEPKESRKAGRPAKRSRGDANGSSNGSGNGSGKVMYVEEPEYEPEPGDVRPPAVQKTSAANGGKNGKDSPLAKKAAIAQTPAAFITGARELIIQVLAMTPMTEEELCRRVADIAQPELAKQLLNQLAQPGADGKYELLDDRSLWAIVNLRDPVMTEQQRRRIMLQQTKLGLIVSEEKRQQLVARHAECKAEYDMLRDMFAPIYKQLRQLPTAEAATEALRLYAAHRDKLGALLDESRAIRAQLK